MDGQEMLAAIRKHYGLKKNAQFAKFFDLTPQNAYSWTNRGYIDPISIYSHCPEINPEWILSLGEKGSMLRDSESGDPTPPASAGELAQALNALANSQEQCRKAQEQISSLLAILDKTVGR